MNHTMITAAIVTVLATLVEDQEHLLRQHNQQMLTTRMITMEIMLMMVVVVVVVTHKREPVWQGDQYQVNAKHALIPLPLIRNRILKIFFPITSPGYYNRTIVYVPEKSSYTRVWSYRIGQHSRWNLRCCRSQSKHYFKHYILCAKSCHIGSNIWSWDGQTEKITKDRLLVIRVSEVDPYGPYLYSSISFLIV